MADEVKKEDKKEAPEVKATEDKENKVKLSKNVEGLVEEIAKLSVMELSELVNALQDKLGVSAMPMVASNASAPAEAGASDSAATSDEGGTVVITASGDQKIAVIKAIREIDQNISIGDAKTMTENVPVEILKDAKPEDAKAAAEKLKAAGATVEIK